MRRIRTMALVAPVLVALACHDATSPRVPAITQVHGAQGALAIPSASAQVSAGGFHTCALKADGTALCWGRNEYGQTTLPAELGPVVQISAGTLHTCALKADGTVVCWGRGSEGQTTAPAGLSSVVRVDAGNGHNCALKTDRTVICWGAPAELIAVPDGLASVAQVDAGFLNSCALQTDATLLCWGLTDYAGYDQTVPVGLGTVAQVSTSGFHVCALKTDGAVVCWGHNNNTTSGEIGGQTDVPSGLGPVSAVIAGGTHTCVLKADATVSCWGAHDYGDPTVPAGLASVTQVSAGAYHTCALKMDGTVACWGSNSNGQADVPAGLNLNVAAQTISFTSMPPSPAYVGDSYAAIATATSGLAVTFSTSTAATCSASGSAVVFIAAGNCTVTANQAGNAAYLAAPEQTQSFSVVRRQQTITFSSVAPNQPLPGETYAVIATSSSGLSVSLTSLTPATCTLTGSTATFGAAGACTIAADQAGNASYLASPQESQYITVVTVAQAAQNLANAITDLGLPAGVANSLSAPLNNFNPNNLTAACGKLNAFINQVDAKLANGQLTASIASQLIQAANAIKVSLGCT